MCDFLLTAVKKTSYGQHKTTQKQKIKTMENSMLLSGFLLFVYLCFLHLKVPTLMKATADDETPCPGYLFQEIGSILVANVATIALQVVL